LSYQEPCPGGSVPKPTFDPEEATGSSKSPVIGRETPNWKRPEANMEP
jgi:hypothetical protein